MRSVPRLARLGRAGADHASTLAAGPRHCSTEQQSKDLADYLNKSETQAILGIDPEWKGARFSRLTCPGRWAGLFGATTR